MEVDPTVQHAESKDGEIQHSVRVCLLIKILCLKLLLDGDNSIRFNIIIRFSLSLGCWFCFSKFKCQICKINAKHLVESQHKFYSNKQNTFSFTAQPDNSWSCIFNWSIWWWSCAEASWHTASCKNLFVNYNIRHGIVIWHII